MPGKSKLVEIHRAKVEKILKDNKLSGKEYGEFLSALNDLNKYTDTLLIRQSNGMRPRLTADVKEQLGKYYEKVINACNQIIGGKEASNDVQLLVKEIKSVIDAENGTLSLALEKDGYQEIMDRMRNVEITMNADQLETAGGMLSSRIPIEYMDGNGNKVSGFFTTKHNLDYKQEILDSIEEFKQKQKDVTDIVSGVFISFSSKRYTSWMNEYPDKDYNQSLEGDDFISEVFHDVITKKMTWGIQDDEAAKMQSKIFFEMYNDNHEYYKKGTPEYAEKEAQFIKNSRGLMDKLLNIVHQYCFYTSIQNLHSGINIDQMNSAMSDVAKLLGMEKLLCNTQSMTIMVDGKTTKGTFMAKAEGLDYNDLPKEHPFYKKGISDETNGTILKDLYNLQVLDYICGNIDRHTANLFYQFDKEGNPIGVQGIDNDCAFGLFSSGNDVYSTQQLVKPAFMKLIPKSTADKIMLMDDNILKSVLKGRELSDDQISFACKRLKDVRKAIIDGKIKVVDDLEFSKMNLKEVFERAQKEATNYIKNVGEALMSMKDRAAERGKPTTHKFNQAQEETVNTPVANQKMLKGLQAEAAKLGWNDFFMLPSSQDLVNMKTAATTLKDVLKLYKDKPFDEKGVRQLSAALKNVQIFTQAYIDKKADKASLRFYEKGRLNFAKGLNDFVTKRLKDITPIMDEISDRRERNYDYIADVAADTVKKVQKMDELAKALDGIEPADRRGAGLISDEPKGDPKAVGDMVKEINKLIKENAEDDPSNHYAKNLVRSAMKYLSKENSMEQSGLTKNDLEDTMETIKKGLVSMGESIKEENLQKDREILKQVAEPALI